ncbi:MAG: hypothetical protein Kow0025_07920 [Thermodesulfovibrionales bacterium]
MAEDERKERLAHQIQRLSVAERIKLAMLGGNEERGLLIKDSNREVVLAVLENPRITDAEVEAIARNRSALDDALRTIAKNREWMKNYSIQLALVTNPKTPPGVSIRFVNNLRQRDLKLLEKNRGVPEVVRTAARRALKAKYPS